jgi:hypothetical protein
VGVRSKTQEWQENIRQALDGLPDHGRTVRILFGFVLFLLAFGALVGLNLSLRAWGLWGDLAFALIVTTLVLWALTRATRPLLGRNKEFRAFPRAVSATVLVLVGFPVAFVTWPIGAVLLALPLLAWGVIVLVRRLGDARQERTRPQPDAGGHLPPLWPAALAGVGLVLLFVALRPSISPADTVPRAVPAAQLEEADADLADRFRPLLFFDSGEQRYPLDIEDAIGDGRIKMCRSGVRGDDCQELESATQIDDSFSYLEVSDAPPPRRGGDDGSAYYYHVVRKGQTVYVDYWWFYSRNPSPVAGEVFCGPGLRTPPFTCQEHAGDWEGLTVVLQPCPVESGTCVSVGGDLFAPVAVGYAQHEHVVSYPWVAELEQLWSDLPRPTSAALAPVWEEFVLPSAVRNGARPLVFVARNSHASYPTACFRNCKQQTRDLPEGRFDGGQPWTHNGDCDDCLKPLPLTTAGDPALWNAFSGRWGAQRCILAGAYCDLSGAPRSPSVQGRYRDPAGEEG